MKAKVYKNVKVLKIIDGDTFDVEIPIDVGFNITVNIKQRLRIRDLDTPETYRPSCLKEKWHGNEAKFRAKQLLENKTITILTYKTGKYGRYIADIILPDNKDYATLMKEESYQKRNDYEIL
jgi:endonuclease YncB( thermonuclease family)